MSEIRTRFAPSPTGKFHLGNAHTALYCWLYARRHEGSFILRIEDTDKERNTEENLGIILDGMAWLGMDYDEGPYFQSQRFDEYKKMADKLIEEGKAYRCTCKPEDLEAKRQKAREEKRTYLYDRCCRDANHGPDCGPHVVRLKMPVDGVTAFEDRIKGFVEYPNTELDDWIISRTDGTPTYNFVVVIDDAQMGITHVVRGDDHLNNTPKQIHVYKALGYAPPAFAHMPLILGKGGGKLSKRHGATSVVEYRQMGYLPSAVRNYLARLGWAHGDQEIFSDEELIQYFDIDDIGKSPSVFDPDKFLWTNEQHIQKTPPEIIAKYLMPFLFERNYSVMPGQWLFGIIDAYRQRAKTLVEMADAIGYFFVDELEYDEKAVHKFLKGNVLEPIQHLHEQLTGLDEFNEAAIKPLFDATLEKFEIKFGKIAQPLRVAITGKTASPGIFETMELLGKDKTVDRIGKAIAMIEKRVAENSGE